MGGGNSSSNTTASSVDEDHQQHRRSSYAEDWPSAPVPRSNTKDPSASKVEKIPVDTTIGQECSVICNPHLRDPLTISLSFIPNPSHFRRACKFTLECMDQAIYLEGFIPCAYGTSDHHHPNPVPLRGQLVGATVNRFANELRDIVFQYSPLVLSLPNGFLSFTSLRSVVFQSLGHLGGIGTNCLQKCNHLESVTLKQLPSLVSIGDKFLYHCPVLHTMVVEDCPELTSVGNACISDCRLLKTVAFKNVPKLNSIGDLFIGGLSSGKTLAVSTEGYCSEALKRKCDYEKK